MSTINLYQMDCMEFMRSKPDKHYQLAIVDPPYFTNADSIIIPGGKLTSNGIERRKYKKPEWEPPRQEYFTELQRISEHQIIWGINYYDIHNIGQGRIVWDKVNDTGTDFSDCEIAYCSKIQRVVIYRYMWNGMIQGKGIYDGTVARGNKSKNEPRFHPTQKPVNLYKWLIDKFANPGDRLFDSHLGSGSSLIAACDMGYEIDGCEIDQFYYGKILDRLAQHQQQLTFDLR